MPSVFEWQQALRAGELRACGGGSSSQRNARKMEVSEEARRAGMSCVIDTTLNSVSGVTRDAEGPLLRSPDRTANLLSLNS